MNKNKLSARWKSGACRLSLMGSLAMAPLLASPQVALSTFDSGLDGWVRSNSTDLYWLSSGGNPGGYLRFSDITSTPQHFTAPSNFLGDWRELQTNSGALTFDHAFLAISDGTYNFYIIEISGPGGSATWYSCFTSYHVGWWNVRVPIDRTQWRLISGDWDALLTNVTMLRFQADVHTTQASVDEGGFDNIRLGPSAVTRIEPKGTFLRTQNDPGALEPLKIELRRIGLQPGDVIKIIPVGDYAWTASPPESGRTVLAVFSSSDVLTGPANLHRIPGAIDLVDFLEYPSPPTFHGGLPTDIDEDFAIHDSSIQVTIPAGATHLLLAAVDVFFGDNTDLNGDFGVTISRVSTPEPVGFWKFDEGTAVDSSTFGNHGINFGVPQVFGVVKGGMQFNGGSQYIRVPNSVSLNPPYQATIAAWFKPAPFEGSGNDPIIDKAFTSHSPPYYQYHLGLTGSQYTNTHSAFNGNFATGGSSFASAYTRSGYYTNARWYFLTAVYDGTCCVLYDGGVQVGWTVALPGTLPNFPTDVFFGKYGNRTSGPVGVADEIRIYDRALTQSEVQDLYDHPAPPRPLSGTIILEDYVGAAGTSIEIEVRTPGDAFPLKTYTALVNADGSYTTTVYLEGTYDCYVKASHWLRKKLAMVTVGPSGGLLSTSLKNGDCDGDNEVGISDYALLSAIYGLSVGDPGYDTNADLNGDTTVDIADYAILSANYGEVGD